MSFSFRARLAFTMSGLILLIAAAIWIYLPHKLEEEAVTLISHKAETLGHLTAFTIHPSLYFRDPVALDEALRGTRQDKDVAYVIVTAADGRHLAAFRPERARAEALARRTAGGGPSSDGVLYEVMVPIEEAGQELARLYIGMSMDRLNREVRETRVAIGILSLIILAAGLLAVVLISNVLTRPLRAVAEGAERIAAGELGHRVPDGRGDEIGLLASSFNDMAASLAARDASLRRSHDQLRMLSRRLLSVQEEERVRIAREVHDELGQALTAMKIDIQQIGRREPLLQEPLSSIGRTIDDIVDIVRRIATDLRPTILDDLGVTAALEQQLRRVRESTGITTTLVVSEEPALDMLTGATLYRIAQEGLANVVRHAHASEVRVTLDVRGGSVVLEIRDNGEGISPELISSTQSLGILGMRERAEMLGGTVKVDSHRGEGTVLTAVLPLAKDDRDLANPLR